MCCLIYTVFATASPQQGYFQSATISSFLAFGVLFCSPGLESLLSCSEPELRSLLPQRKCLPCSVPLAAEKFTSSTPAASDFFAVRACLALRPFVALTLSHGSNGNNFRRRSMREGNFNFKLAIGSENRLALDLLHRRTSSFSPHSVLHTVRTQSPSVRRPSVSLRVSSSMAAIMMMTMMAHTNTH